MINSKILLVIAAVLIVIGLVKPNLENVLPNNTNPTDNIVVVTPPTDNELRDKCQIVIDALKNGDTDRRKDGKRLAELFVDMSNLISLDQENEVIKTTEEIRQANALCGLMLRMNIKGKYPGLADATQAVVVNQIGDDIVPLDDNLRDKASKTFMALAWAFNEGSK